MADEFITLLTPANNSGVLGLARTSLDGNVLTVDVAAAGLTPDAEHPLHLHGFLDGSPSQLATYANDQDGDGVVETAEGEAAFGPVIAGLTANGNARYFLETWPDAFAKADGQGNLSFHQSYPLDASDPAQNAILNLVTERLEGRVLEFHGAQAPEGLGAGTGGEANGAGGYNVSVPVAEGLLLPGAGLDGWLGADSATFLASAAKALSLLAPYSLAPDGSGPAAPEAPDAAATGATDFAALLLPSNGSGALGIAAAHLDRAAATLSFDLWLAGLTPNEAHAGHIHGFEDGARSLLPNLTLDADTDGFVEDAEGEPVVGPVILALTRDGSISDAALGPNFPVADANGEVRLSQVYHFDTTDPMQQSIFDALEQRLAGREVQFHGLAVPATEGEGTPGEVDGTAGYKAELPVANGILLPIDGTGPALDPSTLAQLLAPLLPQLPPAPDAFLL
jgi:hypothetical protein